MENPLISLKEYLDKGKPFLIPYYQRGYIWGKSRDTETDSVQFLIESIKNCFAEKSELFLQGITVCETQNQIELIDGQQRTTALYLLLQYLEYEGQFVINYPMRIQSQNFINFLKGKTAEDIVSLCAENKDEEYQDIYFFKKSIRTIHEQLIGVDKKSFIKYLLEEKRVKFLYINIPQANATTVFSMMNGNKAVMRYEEIIKAELLRLVSCRKDTGANPDAEVYRESILDPNLTHEEKKNILLQQNVIRKEQEAIRWDQDLTRSKYAREWDKWLYWWNKKEIQDYYHTSNVMGLLVETFFYGNCHNLKFNFENFRDCILRDKQQSGKDNTFLAKEAFYKMRQLQKKFEDVYNSYEDKEATKRLHNKIGVIQTLFTEADRKNFIRAYYVDKNDIDIDEYMMFVYLRLTFTEIETLLKKNLPVNNQPDTLQEKKDALMIAMQNDYLYEVDNKPALIQLLRRNIEEDTKLGRKFNFTIYKENSLEHIYPKSKVYHNDNGILKDGKNDPIQNLDSSYLNRDSFDGNGSEHCIGNMVLLYKNENSSFGAEDFDVKKSLYFNLARDKTFRSRHLLHSISVFAHKEWGVKEIQANKVNFINEVKRYYGI